MSTDAIGSALSSFVRKTAAGGNSPSATSTTAPSSALDEAKETAQVTAKEAARGDRQAIAKLARDLKKQQAQAAQSAPVKEAGKGEAVDHSA